MSRVPENSQSQPDILSSRSRLHSASVALYEPFTLGESGVQYSPAVFPAKKVAVVRLSLLLDMLLLSAAEAVDQSEGLVTCICSVEDVIWHRSGFWPR